MKILGIDGFVKHLEAREKHIEKYFAEKRKSQQQLFQKLDELAEKAGDSAKVNWRFELRAEQTV